MRARYVLAVLAVSVATDAKADDWPAFRGGARGGVAEARTLPAEWSAERNCVWKQDVPGRGWSSPVVSGGCVYLTSVVSSESPPEARKGLYIQNLVGKAMPGEHRWLVHCLDLKSGKTLWTKEAHKGQAPGPIHIKNTYASETPVTDGERVYAVFGNVGVFCYNRDGTLRWSHKLEAAPTRMGWGTAASPALHKDLLFVLNDNDKSSYLLALDTRTGKEAWKVERAEKSNWTTPFIWDNGQRTEVVTAGTGKVRSYDLEGKLLWELGGMSSIAIPTPAAGHGLLFVTSGYVADSQRPLYAIRPGASGDITLKRDEASNKHIAWSQPKAGPYHPSPLVYGDQVYILLDRGMLSCYEAKTGKAVYERQRLEGGSAFTASPWAYGGKVYCLSEDGETFVVQAGKEFKVLGKHGLGEMALASPALADGSLLLRTEGKLYRFRKE